MSSNGEDIIRETFSSLAKAIGVQIDIPDEMIANLAARLQAQIDLLAELQSTGRLLVADEMRLTAEQVEDVEALVATANPYSAPAARLRALFPATEPAEVSAREGDCALPPTHDGPCTPAPAVPAEEETKAEEAGERDGLAMWLTGYGIPDLLAEGIATALLNDYQRKDPASSPVVPAPTETAAIGQAAVALRAALDLVDPLEDGDWEHAWRTVEDLEDCAKRAEAIAPFVAAEEG